MILPRGLLAGKFSTHFDIYTMLSFSVLEERCHNLQELGLCRLSLAELILMRVMENSFEKAIEKAASLTFAICARSIWEKIDMVERRWCFNSKRGGAGTLFAYTDRAITTKSVTVVEAEE